MQIGILVKNILTWKRIRRIRLYGESEVQNLVYCTSSASLVLMPTQHRLASSTEQIERNGAMSKTIRQKVEYDSFKTRSLTTRQSFKHTYTHTYTPTLTICESQTAKKSGSFLLSNLLIRNAIWKTPFELQRKQEIKKKFSLSFKK